MANICTTTIYVEGKKESIEKLDKLFNKIECDNNNLNAADRRSNWIGNLLLNSGLNPDKYDTHRAFICDYGLDDNTFYILMESAWAEKMEAMKAIFNSVDRKMKFYYFAEEFGTEYYVSNDVDNKYFGDYYVEGYAEDYSLSKTTGELDRFREIIGEKTFFTAKELKDALAELLHDSFTELDTLIEKINNGEEYNLEKTGISLYIYEIKKVNR